MWAVFNHALLVSRSDWVGVVKHLVIDEAHNLEESATSALSDEIGDRHLRNILTTIWDDKRRWGTLGRLADAWAAAYRPNQSHPRDRLLPTQSHQWKASESR